MSRTSDVLPENLEVAGTGLSLYSCMRDWIGQIQNGILDACLSYLRLIEVILVTFQFIWVDSGLAIAPSKR